MFRIDSTEDFSRFSCRVFDCFPDNKSDAPRFRVFLVHHPRFSAQIPVFWYRCTMNQPICGTSLFEKGYITLEIIQRREQWDVVEAACDAYIVKPVEIFFADDIHLPASGVETHFEQRYGRLAGSKDVHYDHVGFFEMFQFPVYLIVHLARSGRVPVFLSRIEEDIPPFHCPEFFVKHCLPVDTVAHVYGSGKEYLREALVFYNFCRKIFMRPQHVCRSFSCGSWTARCQSCKCGNQYYSE